MKKTLAVTALSILVLSTSCQNKTAHGQFADDSAILKLNDSITTIFNRFDETNDTTMMLRALELCDIVLSLDLTEEGQYFGTSRKIQVLGALGRNKEAFFLQDKTTNPNPDSIDRIIYNGIAAKLKKDDELAEDYFQKGLDFCNKELAGKEGKNELFITKMSIYLYLNKKEIAIKELDERLSRDSSNQMLTSLKENLDEMYDEAQKFFRD